MLHAAYAKIYSMNEGENSGASVTPGTRDTSEEVFSVRHNPTVSNGTFSVVENSTSPKVQNKNSIADQMAAELALAEADEGVLSVHDDSKTSKKKKKVVEETPIAPATGGDDAIETIKASGQDYANAFSLIDDGDADKSVTVGSATGISTGKGKGKTGFFGRSRYNAEAAEEAKKKAEAKRLAEEEALAKAAAEKAAAEKAAADREAAARAEAERKRAEKEAAEREKLAQAAAKRAAKQEKPVKPPKPEKPPKPAKTKVPAPAPAPAPAPKTPDFFSQAMEKKEDIVLPSDAPAKNSRGKILAIAIIALLVVGGGIAASFLLKKTTRSSDSNLQAFIDNGDSSVYKTMHDIAEIYDMKNDAPYLTDEKFQAQMKESLPKIEEYKAQFAALKLSNKDAQQAAIGQIDNFHDSLEQIILDSETINKAISGDSNAIAEIDGSDNEVYKDFYKGIKDQKAYLDQLDAEYAALCSDIEYVFDVATINTCNDIEHKKNTSGNDKLLRLAQAQYIRTRLGDQSFTTSDNPLYNAAALVEEELAK